MESKHVGKLSDKRLYKTAEFPQTLTPSKGCLNLGEPKRRCTKQLKVARRMDFPTPRHPVVDRFVFRAFSSVHRFPSDSGNTTWILPRRRSSVQQPVRSRRGTTGKRCDRRARLPSMPGLEPAWTGAPSPACPRTSVPFALQAGLPQARLSARLPACRITEN